MIDRRRLAMVLGMLGSVHDSEVVAAARQAERLRRDAGVSWRDLLDAAAEETGGEFDRLLSCPVLTAWDRSFLISIAGRDEDALSPKQRAALQRIRSKERLWCRAHTARKTA